MYGQSSVSMTTEQQHRLEMDNHSNILRHGVM